MSWIWSEPQDPDTPDVPDVAPKKIPKKVPTIPKPVTYDDVVEELRERIRSMWIE